MQSKNSGRSEATGTTSFLLKQTTIICKVLAHVEKGNMRNRYSNMDNRKIWNNIFQLSQAVFRVTHLFPKDEILKRHLRGRITEILYQSSPIFGSKNYENMIKEIHDFRSLLFTSKNCNFVNEKNLIVLIRESEDLIDILDQKNREIYIQAQDQNNALQEVNFGRKIILQNHQNFSHNLAVASVEEKEFLIKKSAPKMSAQPLPTSIKKVALQVQVPTENSRNSSMIGFSVLNSRQQKIVDYFNKSMEEKIRLKDIVEGFKNFPPRTLRQDLKVLCDNEFLDHNGFGPGSFYSLIKK